MRSNRNASIELLRLLSAVAVITLHFNFCEGNGAVSASIGADKYVFLFLEAMCICAVDVFILIAGYFNQKSRYINVNRLLDIILETIFVSFGISILSCVIKKDFNLIKLIQSLIPNNYYVTLYVTLMLVAPFINIIIDRLDNASLSIMMVILGMLFSVFPTTLDVYQMMTGESYTGLSTIGASGSGNGYTIVNFVLLYMVGAYIRKVDFTKKIKRNTAFLLYLLCAITTFVLEVFITDNARSYCNPIVILEAVFIFVMFYNLNITSNLINKISIASFSCYLIQWPILSKCFRGGVTRVS